MGAFVLMQKDLSSPLPRDPEVDKLTRGGVPCVAILQDTFKGSNELTVLKFGSLHPYIFHSVGKDPSNGN